MLAADVLVHKPELRLPVCAHEHRWLQPDANTVPVFSILVNAHNAKQQIRLVLVQLLKMTREAWELIVMDDGSHDGTTGEVLAVLNGYGAWPRCPYAAQAINAPFETARQTGGDLGRECVFAPSTLVRVVVVAVASPGLLETAADNVKLRLAHAQSQFFVLVHDDQLVTVHGWNSRLAAPARRWGDVFSTSMRCAHDFPAEGQLVGPKCADPQTPQPSAFLFHVRDSGNRGPLLLRADATRALGYLDEVGYTMTNSEHELNRRAAHVFGMVSGFLPVPYTEVQWARPLRAKVSAEERDAFYVERRLRVGWMRGAWMATTPRRWAIRNLDDLA